MSHRVLQNVFTAVLAAAFGLVFYDSPLRDALEDRLFDWRTRLAPQWTTMDDIVVVGLPASANGAGDANEPQADIRQWTQLVQQVLAADPIVVALLVAPPYDNPELASVVDLAADDPRLIIGAFDVDSDAPLHGTLPPIFANVRQSIGSSDLETYYWKRVVRSLPYSGLSATASYRHYLLPLLAARMDQSFHVDLLEKDGLRHELGNERSQHFRVNYVRPNRVPAVDYRDLAHGLAREQLKDKAVIIGYRDFVPRGPRMGIASYANTPWQSEGGDLDQGVPVTDILAIGLHNLLEQRWLRHSSTWVHVSQVALVSAYAFWCWQMGVGLAVGLLLLGWFLVMIVHSILFSSFNQYIPLADTWFFAMLATIAGALQRLNIEGRVRAEAEAREQSNREVAAVQDRFLDRLSFELTLENEGILTIFERHQDQFPEDSAIGQAFLRAKSSSQELQEFLAGIQQFASVNANDLRRSVLQPMLLRPILEKIVRRFESRIHANRLTIDMQVDANLSILSDAVLIEQILFNLVSNATKYSPERGEITIHASAHADRVRIAVSDQGPGIAPELQELIFEKFYRVKDDLVYKVKGHGLGLYLSRFFSTLIRGQISVSSRLGHGSTFTLEVPGVGP